MTVAVQLGTRNSEPGTSRADAFTEAREVQWLWKTEAMREMARALVEVALAKAEFAADDLPADFEHGGSGIAGSVFAVLVNNGIIRRAGIRQGGQFYGKERVSNRPGRKDAKLKVFTLADRSKAQAFLRSKHNVKQLAQMELV